MSASTPMPRYRCHKEVWALKIAQVDELDAGGCVLIPVDRRFANIELPPYWHEKHAPKAGGYYVRYDDGYTSYSPTKAFDDGYALIEGRDDG